MSRAPLRVAVLGAGTVGGEVVRGLRELGDRLAPSDGSSLELAAIAVRNLDGARERGPVSYTHLTLPTILLV